MPSKATEKGLARKTLANGEAAISLREEILALAGVDKDRMAKLARKAVDRVDEAMDAQKVTHHTFQGRVVDESVDVDHRARMDGVDRALDLFGGRVSKSATSQAPSGPTNITIVIPRAEAPAARPVEVIEVKDATSQ